MKDHLRTAVDSLRAKGVRLTPQRLAIVDYLFSTPGHSTASTVFSAVSKTLPTLSLSTVYDTLHLFRHHRIVDIVSAPCGERHFEAPGAPHSHLLCSKCGRLENCPAGLICLPPERLSQASQVSGFSIDHAEIMLVGLCPECR